MGSRGSAELMGSSRCVSLRRTRLDVDAVYPAAARTASQGGFERQVRLRRSRGECHDRAVIEVHDPARQPEPRPGQARIGPKTDALDLSRDPIPLTQGVHGSVGRAIFALTISTTMGRTERMMIAMITIPKFSLTTGRLPKKYPAQTNRPTQRIPPTTL